MDTSFALNNRTEKPALPPQQDGVLVLNKPGGLTSAACIARIKRGLGQKKIGHAGTLDPMAKGVLLVLLGQATKLSGPLLEDGEKIYSGLLRLGLVTDKGRLRFWKHRLLFPFWVKGKPVFFAGRDIDAQGDDRRFDNLSGSVPCPYNVDDLVEARRTGRPLFVCEGYTDCLTLTQSGRLAVALGGTQGFKTAWVADFEGLDVYLAFDGDKAGREAAQKVADLFASEGLAAPKIVKLPDGQDVTDYFTHQRSKTRV